MPQFIDKTGEAHRVRTSDDFTKCPDCGAQLVVSLTGKRTFSCGRQDVVAADSSAVGFVVETVTSECRTSKIAARMSK